MYTQRDGETGKWTYKEMYRQKVGQPKKGRDRQIDVQTDKWTHEGINRMSAKEIKRQIDRCTDR